MKYTSPEVALKWAYETKARPITRMSGDSDAKHLSEHDKHAQASLTLSMCERVLPVLHMAYIRLQFGREAFGLDVLCHHLAASFGAGVHSRRSIELILRAYCGEKIGLRDIRKAMSCGMLKAVSLRNRAYDTLDIIHAQAMDRVRMEMDSRGMLLSIQKELSHA